MKKYNILFAIGKDRPGIVSDVSTLLFQHDANIEDSRMAVLGGRFSIMTLFSASAQQLEEIKADIARLRQVGLEAFLYEAEDPAAAKRTPSLPLCLQVRAIDHPGIVQRIVRILHQDNVNIQSLNTEVERAPLSGAPLLELSLQAEVPAEGSIASIKEKLSGLAQELNLDLNFTRKT